MDIMDGIKNFLKIINDNWTSITVLAGLIVATYEKAKAYWAKSNSEKIAIAKSQIRERILKMLADAECDFSDWDKSGSIKRSQVIDRIFREYPILSKVSDQDGVVKWIDNEIKGSLGALEKVIKKN